MKDGNELYESLLHTIEEKKGERIDDTTIPFAVLSHVANNLTSITINGVSQLETRTDYEILCHLYQEWKSQSEMFIRTFKDNPNTGVYYGKVSVGQMVLNRDKFEELFSEIDNLGVFETVDFYSIPNNS